MTASEAAEASMIVSVRDDGQEETEERRMARLLMICRCCVSDGVPRRSFLAALIVGTILNLINQGDALLGGGQVNFAKLILTFTVPYFVATYGAVSFRLNPDFLRPTTGEN